MDNPIDTIISEIESTLSQATPGPWRHHVPDRGYCMDYIVTDAPEARNEENFSDYVAETGNVAGPRGAKFFEKDAAYIVAVNPANMRAVLDELARLKTENEKLRAAATAGGVGAA